MESPARSAYRKATASFTAGDYRSALGLFDEAVRLARKENWKVLAHAMQWKGGVHRALGQVNAVFSSFPLFSLSHSPRQYDEALACYREAETLTIGVFGKESDAMATLLISLVQLLIGTNQLSEARRRALEMQALAEKMHGRGQHYANALMMLGRIAHQEGDFKGALTLFEEAEPLMDPDSQFRATLLNDLGVALIALEQYPRALEIQKKELHLSLAIYGREHPEYATSLCNIGTIYLKLKQFGLAKSHYEQALAIREKVFGRDHPGTVKIRNEITGCQRALLDKGIANEYASDHRMCNRCGAVGTSDGKSAFGRCPFCKRHYFCSKECSDAVDNGLAVHAALCPDAPDKIDLTDDQCRRCRGFGATKKCGRCRGPSYCSPECCKLDWQRHRKHCNAA